MLKLLNQKLVDASIEEESDCDEDTTTNSSTGTQSANGSATKKKGRPKLSTTSPLSANIIISTTNPVVVLGNSPKCKFPNNPMLKKKLLNLQKFLSDYTVHTKPLQ